MTKNDNKVLSIIEVDSTDFLYGKKTKVRILFGFINGNYTGINRSIPIYEAGFHAKEEFRKELISLGIEWDTEKE